MNIAEFFFNKNKKSKIGFTYEKFLENTVRNPELELFLLNVLFERVEMAEIFCYASRVILNVYKFQK